jgi:S1-C subfamily serine protease
VTQVEDLQTCLELTYPGQEMVLTLVRDGDQIPAEVMLGERHAARR